MVEHKKISGLGFLINPDKIILHDDIKPSKLEIELIKSKEGLFEVQIGISGNKYRYKNFISQVMPLGNSEKKATKGYKQICDKIKKGKYQLHLYADGFFKVKIF